jgi:serine/threonine protein kinase
MMLDETGHCPGCGSEGHVGTVCFGLMCCRRGTHRIPEGYFRQLSRLEPELGRLVDGRYLLVKMLGEGGFGRVFVALQLPIVMPVALKVLKKTDDDDEGHARRMREFEKEAHVMGSLRHPNIVQLLDFGYFDGAAYLVTELVEDARTLREEVVARARAQLGLDLADVESILNGVLFGLEEAHRHGLVHRDIKPENIMLQRKPGHPLLPRILDFGLAKSLDSQTQSSVIAGTWAYMAPEQLTQRDLGPWTDLYALGIVAYELMTGRRPFTGDSLRIMVDKRNPGFDVLAPLAGTDIPKPIGYFLKRSLAFDTKARFRTATEFRVAMQAAFAAASQASNPVSEVIDLSGLLRDGASSLEKHEADVTDKAEQRSRVGVQAAPNHLVEGNPKRRTWGVVGLFAAFAVGASVAGAAGGWFDGGGVDADSVREGSRSSAGGGSPAIVTQPSADVTARMHKARGAIASQDWAEALAHLDAVLEVEPGNADGVRLRETVLLERKVSDALARVESALNEGGVDIASRLLGELGGVPEASPNFPRFSAVRSRMAVQLAGTEKSTAIPHEVPGHDHGAEPEEPGMNEVLGHEDGEKPGAFVMGYITDGPSQHGRPDVPDAGRNAEPDPPKGANGSSALEPPAALANNPPQAATSAPGYCARSNIALSVKRSSDAFRACFERRLQAAPNLNGRVKVRWVINAEGRVEDAVATDDTVNDRAITQCILKVMARIRFDKPQGGACTEEWAFLFSS